MVSSDVLGGHFKNTYELLNLRALKISMLHKNHIFQRMGQIFCVEFRRVPLKFHTKYLTHILKDTIFTQRGNFRALRFKSSQVFLKCPLDDILPGYQLSTYLQTWYSPVNSLVPGRCGCNFESIIFKFIMQSSELGSRCEIALRWMPQNLTDEKFG